MRDEDESTHFNVGKKGRMPMPGPHMMGQHHPDDSHLVKGFNSAHAPGFDGVPHPHRVKSPRI